MAILNWVWDCLFSFMFLFKKFFFFHVISIRNAYRTAANNALIGSDKEEREDSLGVLLRLVPKKKRNSMEKERRKRTLKNLKWKT